MADGRITTNTAELILSALDLAGATGLTYTEISKRIAGISGGTVRAYANSLVKQGTVLKRYEQVPGMPYRSPRCRFWLAEHYVE